MLLIQLWWSSHESVPAAEIGVCDLCKDNFAVLSPGDDVVVEVLAADWWRIDLIWDTE